MSNTNITSNYADWVLVCCIGSVLTNCRSIKLWFIWYLQILVINVVVFSLLIFKKLFFSDGRRIKTLSYRHDSHLFSNSDFILNLIHFLLLFFFIFFPLFLFNLLLQGFFHWYLFSFFLILNDFSFISALH